MVTAALVAFNQLPVSDGTRILIGVPLSGSEAIEAVAAYDNVSESGENFSPVEAVGFGGPWSYGISANTLALPDPGCSLLSSSSSPITVYANPSQLAPGYLPDWIVLSVSSSDEVQTTFVTYTTQLNTIVGSLQSGNCSRTFLTFGILPKAYVDSPTIVSEFDNLGGSEFSAAHPDPYQVLLFAKLAWGVTFTTCSPLAPNDMGVELRAGFESGTGFQLGQIASFLVPCANFSPDPLELGP